MNSNGDVIEVPAGEEMPKDAVPIEGKSVAAQLAALNRRGRLAFYSERRRGASQDDALSAAHLAHCR